MNEKLQKALQSESKRFEEFYLWLEEAMPQIFFEEVGEEWVTLIVHALMGFKEMDYFVEIHLRTGAIALCFDSPQADVNILKSYSHYGIKNYTTYISKKPLPFPENPGLLRIATILFTEAVSKEDSANDVRKEEIRALVSAKDKNVDFDAVFSMMSGKFLRKLSLDKQVEAILLCSNAMENDACQYKVIAEEGWMTKGEPSVQLILAWKNVPKHNFLYRLARVVYQHGLVMKRVDAAYLNPNTTRSVLMLALGLHGSQGQAAWDACDMGEFLQEIVTLKYFGSLDPIEETFVIPGKLNGNMANLLRSILHYIHQMLVHADPNLYTVENVLEGLTRHPELTVKVCEAFDHKFNPKKTNLKKFQELRGEFLLLVKQLDTGQEVLDERRKNILAQAMNFVEYTLKTNFFCPNKTSFGFRLDPAILDHVPYEREKIFPELPYSIFFFKGMHHIGFHVRFRDLARGGLRTIFPEKKERMLAERGNVFLECYHLAYTQQKKNKDIPEGGAKGVIFLKPYERLDQEAAIYAHELAESGLENGLVAERVERFKEEQKLEYLYQTQRSYIKTFLMLINCEPDGQLRTKDIVDYWKRPEYIYLGPDENMHNSMIDWIAEESIRERYKPGGAFISGKSKVGINHKQYGVTSLGVNVYMEEVLRYLHIDPLKDSFTVKMTGGPDGDVAGNQILNIYRYYPKTAKLLALTDVSGTIFDPVGLDLAVCVDLFRNEKSIRHYPPDKLNPGGFLLDKMSIREMTPYVFQTQCFRNEEGTIQEEWMNGNEMNALYRYNVHRTKADVFIPCGGRPRTLRETNVEEFLDEAGAPTSQAIVEGANLYLSPKARHLLEERGVLIFKDSSANKCGVISSSFEILSGLTLTSEEFLAHKEQLVEEILERLRKLSLEEARLLLKSHEETGQILTVLSDKISTMINHYTDELLEYLEKVELSQDPHDPLNACFLSYCLKTLREKFQERLLKEIPPSHKKAIIASHIASRVVYHRGLGWSPSVVDVLPLILGSKDLF